MTTTKHMNPWLFWPLNIGVLTGAAWLVATQLSDPLSPLGSATSAFLTSMAMTPMMLSLMRRKGTPEWRWWLTVLVLMALSAGLRVIRGQF